MKPNRWLIGLCVGLLALLVVNECIGSASKDAEAATILQDSLRAWAPAREARRVVAAQQDTLVATLRASLEAERNDRVAERAQTDVRIADARETGAAALDSARSLVVGEAGRHLYEHALQDSVMIAGYESTIVSLEADTVAMALELVETRRQALFNRQGWDLAEKSLGISMRESASWQSAYVAQRRKGLFTKVGGGVLLVLALVVR